MEPPLCSLELTDTAPPDTINWISESLFDFNNRAVGSHDFRPLIVLLRDPHQEVVGGLVGWTRWHWAHIDNLWIAEAWRRSGSGSQILAMAEAEAQNRGCHLIDLDTFNFQAPAFYAKHGYQVMFTLEIDGPQLTKTFLKKSLAPVPSAAS